MSSRWIVLCALFASTAAFAQLDPPNGIKIGDGRLHPYFDLEGRYDSAAIVDPVTQNPGGDIVFRFRPGLKFELMGADTIINFNGNAEYVLDTGLISPGATRASRFQTDIGLETAFNKTGQIEFQLGDQLVRSDRPYNPLLTVGVISLYNSAHVAVPIHPGGGALEVSPKASWAVEFFDPLMSGSTCASCGTMNYSNVGVGLGARWRFLPKTAVVFDGGVDLRTYWNGAGKPATLMKLQVGLAGLISSKITLLLLAGYGQDFADSTHNPTFIAQAEVGIHLSDAINFKAGYVRTLLPVPVYGIYGDDRGYADVKAGYGRFTVAAGGALDYLTFYGTPQRRDTVITLNVTPAFQIFSWFTVSAGYILTSRASSPAVAGASFIRHEAMLELHFSY